MFNPSKFVPNYPETKSVIFFNISIVVPFWTTCLACNRSGCVYAYEDRPIMGSCGFNKLESTSRCRVVGSLQFTGDWRDSLVELPNG